VQPALARLEPPVWWLIAAMRALSARKLFAQALDIKLDFLLNTHQARSGDSAGEEEG
jgi:hypothetical protein